MPSLPIVTGGIYFVPDRLLLLPAGTSRQLHERRPIVVVSGPRSSDRAWPIVLACPISTSPSLRTEFCVKVGAGEGNLPKKGWVRVPAVQPFAKDDLQDYCGSLPPALVTEIHARLLQYMGLI